MKNKNKNKDEYKSVPVSEAKAIAEKYDKAQVLIFAWESKTGKTHITTYGDTLEHKMMAEKGGDRVAKMLGLTKGKTDEDYVSPQVESLTERVGQLVDKTENFMTGLQMTLPPHLHIRALKGGLTDIRNELKQIFFLLGGDKETWTFEVNFKDEEL